MDWQAERRRREKLIGRYSLNVQRTNLGIYKTDSLRYERLILSMNADMTFNFNFRVPFIFDSVGKWNAGGNGEAEWNYMYYQKWGYDSYKKDEGDQFTDCCDRDTTFLVNSVTPQRGKAAVNVIVFKKLNPKSTDFE
jgi:hypothetical protein